MQIIDTFLYPGRRFTKFSAILGCAAAFLVTLSIVIFVTIVASHDMRFKALLFYSARTAFWLSGVSIVSGCVATFLEKPRLYPSLVVAVSLLLLVLSGFFSQGDPG